MGPLAEGAAVDAHCASLRHGPVADWPSWVPRAGRSSPPTFEVLSGANQTVVYSIVARNAAVANALKFHWGKHRFRILGSGVSVEGGLGY